MTLNTLSTAGFSNFFFFCVSLMDFFLPTVIIFYSLNFSHGDKCLMYKNSKKKEQNIEQNINQSGLEQLVDISF